MNPQANSIKWLLIIVLAIIWGSSFILMKRGLDVYTPGQVASIRMFSSFLFLLPFVARYTKEIPADRWKWIFATGFFGNGAPAFLFATAQTVVVSATAGILNSMTPVFTLLLGFIFFRASVGIYKILGVLLGFGGAAALIFASYNGSILSISWYSLLIVLATLGYATSVNIMRHRLHEVRSVLISGFALFFVGPPTGIYLFTTDFLSRLSGHDDGVIALIYILLLALFGTAISIVMFNYLVKISGAIFASSVTYLIPVVALIWGFADGERLEFVHLMALGGILLGVYLINLKTNKLKSD